ncbi:MAG: EamA family transporter RarD [Pseudomonadota bacterium]
MTETQKGVTAIILACMIWGLSGLFYKLLADVPALLVLAHRTIWGVVFFLIILAVWGDLRQPVESLRSARAFGIMALASGLIAVNWLAFVYAIQTDQALEASLGYFIFPLVTILLGLIVFRETLVPAEWIAIALAFAAVATLTMGLGVAPWIALVIGLSFGCYGALKKNLPVGPVVSVTAESLLLLPLALGWLVYVAGQGDTVFGGSWGLAVTLFLSGPITATPLILFSYGARKIKLTTVGVLSYLNPSLQFLVATLLFLEPFGLWHAIAFGMIWTALALYTAARLRQDKVSQSASSSAGTSSTTRIKSRSETSAKSSSMM